MAPEDPTNQVGGDLEEGVGGGAEDNKAPAGDVLDAEQAGVGAQAVKDLEDQLRKRPYERWLILAVTSVGGLLASIQSSALVIAFPKLIEDLNAGVITIMWVLLSFLLVCAAITIITGKLGDIFGQANLFKFGYVIFTISSLLSGFSQPDNQGLDLVGYRCLMGLGATFLFTNSMALVVDAFAPFNQVGISQGIFQLAFASGSVLGPVVGGGLAVADWRWIFWINVPCAGLMSIISFFVVRQSKNVSSRTFLVSMKHFDWGGMILMIGFVMLIMLALVQSAAPDPNLSSAAGLSSLVIVGSGCLAFFCLNEAFFTKEPLIHLPIFKNIVFTMSQIGGALVSFARGLMTYGMIFFLQGPRGDDPLTAGIQLIPFGLGIIIAGFVSGVLTDRIGVRNLSIIGPIIAMTGSLGLAFCYQDTNYWLVAFALFVVGLGSGVYNSPNGAASMMSIKLNERGVSAAIRLLLSFLTAMIGIVIAFALVLNSLSFQELFVLFIYGGGGLSADAVASVTDAIHILFWITFASFGAAAITSVFIPGSFSVRGAMAAAQAEAEKAKQAQQTELKEVASSQPEPTAAPTQDVKTAPELEAKPSASLDAVQVASFSPLVEQK